MKLLLTLISTLFITTLLGQEKIEATNIYINYDYTIHIVFNNTVEYVSVGSEKIEAVIVNEMKNIIRLQALEESFLEKTNLTIFTKGGNIFSFNVTYRDTVISTVFFPEGEYKNFNKGTISINKDNSSHLIFESEIIYFKQGDESRFSTTKTSAKNIIEISMLETEIGVPSNIFITDLSGNIYNIDIFIKESSSYVYNFGTKTAQIKLNEDNLEDICKDLLQTKKREVFNLGGRKNKFEILVNNIFVKNNYIYFIFSFKNSSNIDLDLDLIKCFIVDNKTGKNSIKQEIIVDYIYSHNLKKKIEGNTSLKFILVFDKFTIPDNKNMLIEFLEKDGGRHSSLKILNKHLLIAKEI